MQHTGYSRAQPSPRYAELQQMYRSMHREGEKFLNIPPEQTFPGQSLPPQAGRIKRLIDATGAKSLLDYGSGKGLQYQPMRVNLPDGMHCDSIQAFWGVTDIRCFDPAYLPFSALPVGTFDGVVSTDVLEHCPEDDIPWIIDEIFSYATRFVFANVACYPAKKRLPNGENAHCTIRPPEWWRAIVESVAARHPNLLWEFWIQYRDETPEGPKLIEQRLGN
jgi:hypothetical protein